MFPWHQKTWDQIQAMQGRLPHAMLFHGQSGIGKFAFVRHLAKSLLCEQPQEDGHACNACASCHWFEDRSHMDFRMLRPEALDVAEGLEADAEDQANDAVESTAVDEKKSKRAPSKEIRIEQVRALAGFLNIGTHRGGKRIVLLYPLSAMNVFTANALLKMLEEPPPNTVFLLIADGLDRVLPTILSRCRHLNLPMPGRSDALAWLIQQGISSKNAESALAESGGAPLGAQQICAQQSDEADLFEARRRLLEYLGNPVKHDPLQLAEQIGKSDLRAVLGWIQRWIFDCISYSSAQRIRYYPSCEKEIAAIVRSGFIGQAPGAGLWDFAKQLSRAKRVVDHPLNPKLFIEALLLGYAASLSR